MPTQSAVRILIVDDDLPNRVLVCIMCERAGYSTARSKDAREALATLQDMAFDLMIIELDLEDMDGIELIKKVRAREESANLPILIMAKVKDAKLAKLALDAGANDFIFKPILHHNLIDQLRMLLEVPDITKVSSKNEQP